jgi:hypothetical protein
MERIVYGIMKARRKWIKKIEALPDFWRSATDVSITAVVGLVKVFILLLSNQSFTLHRFDRLVRGSSGPS